MTAVPSSSAPVARRASRWRAQSIVTTVLLILLAALVVRDIFARRWGAPVPPSSGVTERRP
jgi:hypothetical protein